MSQLTTLQNQQRSISLATEVDGYKKGFKDCARETIRYLTSAQALDTDSLFRLNNHLQSCYLEKTGRAPNASYPTEVPSAHISTVRSDIQQAGETNSKLTHHQLFYGPVTQSRVVQPVPGDYGQFSAEYQYYHPCNDSVDSSLNSSCNMSLDSSTSIAPEKVVPYQSTEDDVWRPW